MIAKRKFIGVIDGEEREFRPGDTISAKEAKEMGLEGKPALASKKGKARDAETSET